MRPRHHQTPRRVIRRTKGYINRNSINERVCWSEWVQDSMEKDFPDCPDYISRKSLYEDYALLDAVRHVGPRRRAEMRDRVGDIELARQKHKDVWCKII